MSPLIRRVGTYTGLQALTQVALLAASLILAVIIGPSGFGRYSVFLSLSVILSALLTLRFDQIIAGAAERDEAIGQLRHFLGYVAIAAAASPVIIALISTIDGIDWVFASVVVIAALATATISVLSAFSLRLGSQVAASTPRLVFSFTLLPCQYAMLHWFGDAGVLYGHVAACLVGCAAAVVTCQRAVGVNAWREGKPAQRKHVLFSASGVMNTVTNNAPVQVVAYLFGDATAGFFAVAIRALGAPLLFLGNAISTALVSELARGHVSGSRDWKLFGVVGVAFAVLVLATADGRVIEWAAPGWGGSAVFLVLFAPVYGMRITAIPAVAEILRARDGRFLVTWESVRIAVLVVLALITGVSEVPWCAALAGAWLVAYGSLWLRGWRIAAGARP